MNFVTLFNSYYLSRGLVLYHSLKKHCPGFHLYVVAFDDTTYNYFLANPLPALTVISLEQFENKELKAVKGSRSTAEYCWTCTPSTVAYCMEKFSLENCTYLDADMCFYSDPTVLVDEMGSNSVLITDHRYTKKYDQSATSGRYCVQFVTFKNTPEGLTVLNWWKQACIEWCFDRFEDGKFGDQKYLDIWTTQFKGVHELKHLGGGLAPWNVQQYSFETLNGKIFGVEKSTKTKFQAVFFHFHSLKFFQNDIVLLSDTGYDLDTDCIDTFYKPYVQQLVIQNDNVRKVAPELNANGATAKSKYLPAGLKTWMQYYTENLRSSKKNILGLKLLQQIKNHYYFYLKEFN